MECDECQKPMDGGMYFEMDAGAKKVCERCYEKSYEKKCDKCKERIRGTFYTAEDKAIICAHCYMKQHGDEEGRLVCRVCREDVKGQIIRAVGAAYHPECFCCIVCKRDLSTKAIQFTTDKDNNLYCQADFNEKFAPRCCSCKLPIAPKDGETSAQRITAFNMDWHPQCFKCQDCDILLNSKIGKECYPIEETPLCLECNRMRKKTSHSA